MNKDLVKILLVGDSPLIIKMFNDDPKYHIDMALDVTLAIDLLKEADYNIVIVAEESNGASTFEILHSLSMLQLSTPVILMVSMLNAENILMAYDLAAYDILALDSGEEIITVIENALNPIG